MKEQLLRTGIALFRQHGYDRVTVQQICQACRVTKGSFYHHFRSKEELLMQYYDIQVQQDSFTLLSRLVVEADLKKQIWLLSEFFIDSSLALGPDLLRQLIKADLDRGGLVFSPYFSRKTPLTQQYLSLMQQLLEQGQRQGVVRPHPWSQLTLTYAAAFHSLLAHWAASDGQFNVKEQLREILQIILYADQTASSQ